MAEVLAGLKEKLILFLIIEVIGVQKLIETEDDNGKKQGAYRYYRTVPGTAGGG